METPTNPENQNFNQNIYPNNPQNNIYKILFFIFLGLFLVVFSVLITLFFTQKKLEISKIIKTEEQKIIPTKTPISEITDTPITPTVTLTNTPTSSNIPKDWKTYTNKNFGVSFQYPVNYKVNINTTLGELYVTEITENMAAWFNIIKVNNEDLATFIKNNSEYKKTDFMIGNQKGIKFRSAGPEELDYIYLTVGTSNYKFLTELSFDDPFFTQILSTFKFI